jgi:NAD(P)-dependent dehydrogenase (short-subunit alcohol dehydrogenase family)
MSDTERRRPVCAIAGVGRGNGEAFARRFAAEGYSVGLLARNKERIETLAAQIPGARAFACDVTAAASVEAAYAAVEAELGPAVWRALRRSPRPRPHRDPWPSPLPVTSGRRASMSP